ncbi:MAG: phosphoribosylamine--glycine ligase [Bdellovibrionales bacterium]|nr:phosphoribosylamine--glycine ligase [Bdellovibrionales bacterium]
MNVLVIGKGGREQALVRALATSPQVGQIFVWPGRAGFEPQAICLQNQTLNKNTIRKWVKEKNIDLVVIGPEQELADGWSNFFRSLNVAVFGPSQEAAQLESSKLFAKRFMMAAGVPTSEFKEVDSVEKALTASAHFPFPIVLKADGLAAGKGVFICYSKAELKKAAELIFEKKKLGPAGEKAFLEDFQRGEELSLFVLTNGREYKLLPFARDYKKIKDSNQGPNTGGMGAFAPYIISSTLQKRIEEQVVRPSIKGIVDHKLFYHGLLYIGLMITNKTPIVLEYNIRFGDPEAQVLLPLLDGDWAEVFFSVARGELPNLIWKKNYFTACVVLAGEGYPSQPITGVPIEGNLGFESPHSYFLHAGTKKTDKGWLTDGGRVLNALGLGNTKEEAIRQAYEQAKRVYWPGMQMRSDIGVVESIRGFEESLF